MDQPILQGALPLLSSFIGDDAAAGVVAALSMTISTITKAAAALEQSTLHFGKGQGAQYQSAVMSTLATVAHNINAAFASLTASETPLTTYLLLAFLTYVAFRIVYGIISWIVRSVLNLIKLSVIVAVVTVVLWFIINITSEGLDNGSYSSGGHQQHSRHRDPISQGFSNMQTKFRAEYHRQQQHLRNQPA
ncbi:hypothetical protein EC968_002766 [Mortierella alpina]|nr:hypothetical protein EC968_002766 [Mortierella alpina]